MDRGCALLLAVLLLLPTAMGEVARSGKVLVMGSPAKIDLAALWLEADPLTNPRMVPFSTHLTTLDGEKIKRFIRLYFPRNYESLLEYEYMILACIEISHFTDGQMQMLHDAVYEEGMGGLNTRSVTSMAAWLGHPWAISVVSDAFPNDADKVVGQGEYTYTRLPLRFKINTNPEIPAIFTPYKDLQGVEPNLAPGTTCIAIPKEGAVVTSYTIGNYPTAYPGAHPDPRFKSPGWMPHTMYWEYGNGTTWTHHDMLGGGNYWDPMMNPYVPDMILAEFIFSTGRKLPEDVVLVHRLRTKFSSFISSRTFIYSLLDFIDRFGVSGVPIITRMIEVSHGANAGKALYTRQEYAQSMEEMETAIEEMDDLRSEAMKLKDRALAWVYAIEWLAVSGVSLLVGFALWSLMVQRRLYREVTITRLRTTD
jgi:hypothetical protein